MKLLLLSSMLVFLSAENPSEELGVIGESFEGMFEIEPVEPYIPEGIQGPLNPAVPLDGGLTALLVAGGAVGYRKYRARRSSKKS